jgi:hypothetical protein
MEKVGTSPYLSKRSLLKSDFITDDIYNKVTLAHITFNLPLLTQFIGKQIISLVARILKCI